MQIARRTLCNAGPWRIGEVAVANPSLQMAPEEVQDEHVLVLPLSGVFAKHDTRRRHAIASPTDAVFIFAAEPYRLSYPGGLGDRSLHQDAISFRPSISIA